MAKDTVEVLIEGGSATPGPPLGPALGPFGINMMQVVDEINKKSADFAGMAFEIAITPLRSSELEMITFIIYPFICYIFLFPVNA